MLPHCGGYFFSMGDDSVSKETTLVQQIIEIKGEMLMVNILYLYQSDMDAIQHALELKVAEAEQFFKGTSLVVDCSLLGEHVRQLDFSHLHELVATSGFTPIGLRSVHEDALPEVEKSDWSLIRTTGKLSAKTQNTKATADQNDQQANKTSAAPCVEVIDKPLRSGQQVYAPESDVVVLHQTGAGSEILAGGSVHIYGALRGRVLAGVNGDKTARIFCQALDAELVSIAGCYQLLDDTDTQLKGQPAMIRLENNKLVVEALV
jgi:septum site-determining protein MinC